MYYYKNWRCRKCEKLISVQIKGIDEKMISFVGVPKANMMICNSKHVCNIEPGEAVVADFISYSENPLSGAEVIALKSDN